MWFRAWGFRLMFESLGIPRICWFLNKLIHEHLALGDAAVGLVAEDFERCGFRLEGSLQPRGAEKTCLYVAIRTLKARVDVGSETLTTDH